MSHHLVETSGLEYTYPDGTPALQGVSFRIEHGESVGIVGGNGAGKSTLLLHLNGCLLASKGSVRVGDIPVTKKTLSRIRRSVGMIFQDSNDQLFMPTAEEDVAFGPLNLRLPPEEVKRKGYGVSGLVNAAHLRLRPPYNLSCGEKRSVAVATVLSMSPDILVLDEPSAGLDPHARRNLIKLLRGFTHTKIIASHDLDMILEICTRTIVLHRGGIAADGPTSDTLKNQELLIKSGLELPLRLQECPVCSSMVLPSSPSAR